MSKTAVIVGAGQAGRWMAITLRAQGFDGRIVWLGDEPYRPYERPPLSKAVLQAHVPIEQLALVRDDAWQALNLDWRPADAVLRLDRAARQVHTASGQTIDYDLLFLATGGRPRPLPGVAEHPRILALRSWDDAQRLKAALANAHHLIVLGAGWIGLEVAASARGMGLDVTVMEAASRVCARTVPACVSDYLQALHREHGVTLRLSTQVVQVQADDAGVALTLAGGELVRGDLLLVGIGLMANDNLAEASGLRCRQGVVTDPLGRTEDPAVFAAGDVAHPHDADGRSLRIESWENAQRQAVAAVKAALGGAEPQAGLLEPGWFWSDQYTDNLQVLGAPDAAHRVIERVVPTKRQHLFFFCDGNKVRALAAVNGGREVKVVRRWMVRDQYPDVATLADPTLDLAKLPVL